MITVVTNRKLISDGNLIKQMSMIKTSKVDRIIIREKDLPVDRIVNLIQKIKRVIPISVEIMLNGSYDFKKTFGADGRHYTFDQYNMALEKRDDIKFKIGVSVHSIGEAELLDKDFVDYCIYGHIFETDCKKGLPGRGIENLNNVISTSKVDLIPIGGINRGNYKSLLELGCKKFALMSSVMKSSNPDYYLDGFENDLGK